jgi:aspartyl-tRNA(Asn)/glutamyl-tRNA(Gln) amidotransferase subunit A
MHYYSRRDFLKTASLASGALAFSKHPFAPPDTAYTYMSILELSGLIRNRKVSPVTITRACLKRIEQIDSKLNSFITVTGQQALKDARIAETEIRNGKWKGPLHGIPIALKDNIDTAGILTTAASGLYKNRIPTEDAELVIRLKKAGAIIIGKNNLHEFALGTTSHISFFGAVRNPWNTNYIPGGSSGGSGAAVAAGMCYASIGTDTGGSIRLPAACCGLTGFKPTYGLVSTRGIIPVIQSIDHAGPICRTVEDAAILMNVLATTSSEENNCKWDYHTSFNKIKSPRIGIMKNYKASNEVNEIFRNVISTFQSLGYKTSEVELPTIPASVIGDAEIEAYHRPLLNQFKDLYDPVTFNDINSPKAISSMDYINDINKMEKDRNSISKKLFKNIDVLILPTTASLTPTIEKAKAQGSFALDPFNTDKFNHYGLPAISIPCGFDKNGMPVGLQIVGPRWGENKVLDIAQKFQKNTRWHLKHPLI